MTTDNTRYTPITDYNITKTYYWRVAILDDDNKIGPFTDARTILDPYTYDRFLPLIKR